MDPKTPDFTLNPTSPPHFSYDFPSDPSASPSAPPFDAFAPYASPFDTSPRLGAFTALALGPGPGTHAPSSSPFFSSPSSAHAHHPPAHNPYPATSPTAHSFSSATSAGRPFTPLEGTDLATISPPLTTSLGTPGGAGAGAYPPHVSGSELDTVPHAERRSSTNSPPSSAASASAGGGYNSARNARYNPLGAAPSRPQRPVRKAARRGTRRDDDDLSDEDRDLMMEDAPEPGVSGHDVIQRRREEIRRQRIESEQRRRDELRDGYAKLKYALPISNQKSSKVSLLDRAVTYIRQLETGHGTLQGRLDAAEAELARLRNVNEQLMRNLTDQHRAVALSLAANAQAQAQAAQAAQAAAASAPASTAGGNNSNPPSPPAPAPAPTTTKKSGKAGKTSASSF